MRAYPKLAMRSQGDNGFSTTPNDPDVTGSRTISGRPSAVADSSMMMMRSSLFDDVRKQHRVNALLERAPLCGIRSGPQSVQLRFNLAGVR